MNDENDREREREGMYVPREATNPWGNHDEESLELRNFKNALWK